MNLRVLWLIIFPTTLLDAARFAAVEEGPLGVETHGDFMFRHGVWMVRWRHWAALPRYIRVSVVAHVQWALTRSELYYARHMRPISDDVQRNVLPFSSPQEVGIPRLF